MLSLTGPFLGCLGAYKHVSCIIDWRPRWRRSCRFIRSKAIGNLFSLSDKYSTNRWFECRGKHLFNCSAVFNGSLAVFNKIWTPVFATGLKNRQMPRSTSPNPAPVCERP